LQRGSGSHDEHGAETRCTGGRRKARARRPDRQIRGDVPLAGTAHAGLHVLRIADLDVNRVRKLDERLGWPEERTEAKSLADALRSDGTFLTEDADVLIAGDGVDVIVEPPAIRPPEFSMRSHASGISATS
jgi:predicted homoserine dehydrogenase-like protein